MVGMVITVGLLTIALGAGSFFPILNRIGAEKLRRLERKLIAGGKCYAYKGV
jgi:hypothetical protein